MISIGRKPNIDGLKIENAGILLDDKGRIQTDENFRTNVKNIFAIGDVKSGPMLAHKAEEEGIAAAEYIAGGQPHINYNSIPSVVYTHPEVAWCGYTEEELIDKNIKYTIGQFPFLANSRAKTTGTMLIVSNLKDDSEGFVKVLSSDDGKLMGAHIIGPNAGEMISEAVIAIEYGASAEDIARTCHAHPVRY